MHSAEQGALPTYSPVHQSIARDKEFVIGHKVYLTWLEDDLVPLTRRGLFQDNPRGKRLSIVLCGTGHSLHYSKCVNIVYRPPVSTHRENRSSERTRSCGKDLKRNLWCTMTVHMAICMHTRLKATSGAVQPCTPAVTLTGLHPTTT